MDIVCGTINVVVFVVYLLASLYICSRKYLENSIFICDKYKKYEKVIANLAGCTSFGKLPGFSPDRS